MLSETDVEAAEPRLRPYKIADGHGLYLYVTPAGSKSWRMKYRFAGKEGRLTFGLSPAVSLDRARRMRERARQALSIGIDPRSDLSIVDRADVEELAARSADSVQQSRVYFCRRADGAIKIGATGNVFSRMLSLQTKHGAIELIGSMPGSFALEQALHLRFSAIRLDGEWFSPSDELLKAADGLIDRRGG